MLTRRTFIKNGLLITVAASGIVTYGQAIAGQSNSDKAPRYAMIIVSNRCTGCNSCVAACKLQNGTAKNHFLTTIDNGETGVFPNAQATFKPLGCHHCTSPWCLDSCPENAIHQLENNIVITDWDTCTGDGSCVEACPFDSRILSPDTHKADSCDFCLHLLLQGHPPACVKACPSNTRLFGDLNAPEG
jgi:Fe-S-cluster-containing dehydrogenase component